MTHFVQKKWPFSRRYSENFELLLFKKKIIRHLEIFFAKHYQFDPHIIYDYLELSTGVRHLLDLKHK
jgi:hypothetical protein